jgi:glycosyltransferase involved in cell wall biosynthesis
MLLAASKLPITSIVIPALNEQSRISKCLDSVLGQDYPKKLLEVVVVDNGSTDRTVGIVQEYKKTYGNVRLLFNHSIRDAEVSKMMGLHSANGDLFMYLDADIQLVGTDCLRKIIGPLVDNPGLSGSFPRFIPDPADSPIGRYLRYHPLELDPVLRFFCTEIRDTVIERKEGYQICLFSLPKIPPVGVMVYRRKALLNVIGNMRKFMDIDVPVLLAKSGLSKFSYVPSCGIYHTNIKSLTDLVRKRLRNITEIYLPNIENREFRYFHPRRRKDIIKIALWIVYANLFIPKLVEGVCRAVRHGDLALLYEPVVAIILTDAIIFGFLRNFEGRRWLFSTPLTTAQTNQTE